MSEVLAQLEKKGLFGEMNVSAHGQYTSGATINCNVGDIVILVGNYHHNSGDIGLTNLTQIFLDTYPTGSVTERIAAFKATDVSCSITYWIYDGKVYYVVISAES